MKFIKPSSIAEPTRSMLLAAKDGDMLPAATAATGIEVYAVCGRRAIKADDKQRRRRRKSWRRRNSRSSQAPSRDLRQDAHIEFR